MEVGAQKKAVRHVVLATAGVLSNVRGLKNRKGMLFRCCTCPTVRIKDRNAEGLLAETRSDKPRFAIP